MKTILLHSYSSNSLANISKDNSAIDFYSSDIFDINGGTSITTDGKKSGVSVKDFFRCVSRSVCKKKVLYKKFPILEWSKEYNGRKLIADIIAGLTIGLTILPQGLAYASIAGVPPQYGLYSGFMGCFVYLLCGKTKVANLGPTAIMSIITLSYTRGKPPEYAVLLCFLTGIVTLLMGLCQLGFIVNFISTPVISAFTSAAALTICSTQIKGLLGLSFKADGFRDIVYGAIEHWDQIRMEDATLAGICVVVLLLMQNVQNCFKSCTRRSPALARCLWFVATSRSVVVIIVCTIVFSLLDDNIFPVKVVGYIEPGLPPVRPPSFTITVNNTETHEVQELSLQALMKEDASALIVIPLLALMEHIMIAKKFAGNNFIDASQEMISIGLTNILGSFFSSIPVTGSFSRSTVNAASGAETPLGGVVTGALVILALQYLTPFFYYIPNASLAAVIVTAVIFTVDFEVLGSMWRSKKMDLIPWGITFFGSLLISLEVGILSGVVVSVIFLLYYAARPSVKVKKAETAVGTEFVIVCLDRSLVFPSVEYSRYMIMKSGNTWAKGVLPVVIDCNHIQFADYSAAQGVMDLFTLFNEKKHPLILWRTKPSVIRILKGLMDSKNVSFRYCTDEDDLQRMINSIDDERSRHCSTTSSDSSQMTMTQTSAETTSTPSSEQTISLRL